MTPRAPTEPAQGPHLRLRARSALPPFAKGAAVAFAGALLPWLVFAASLASAALVGYGGSPGERALGQLVAAVLSLGSMAGPIVAVVVGGRVHRRLRALPADERPRGLTMAITARVLGWLTIALWTVSMGVVCIAMRNFSPD
jgi:hypothetical protein